jgi:hypothetical protein
MPEAVAAALILVVPQEQAARVVAATQRPVEPQAMQLLEPLTRAVVAAVRLVLVVLLGYLVTAALALSSSR